MSRFPSSVRFEYDEAHSSNFTAGNWSKNHIVLHWWDNPAKRPQFNGVVSWFKNPSANVSIQYMVEHNRITQMIPESAMAWHSGNSDSNRHGIGIEVNPRLSAGDYEAAAILVAEIWKRRGKLKLRRHRDVNRSTACPGHMDVARIKRRAEQIYSGTTPASSTPVIEGEVMSAKEYAAAVWNDNGDDLVNDTASRRGWRFGKMHEYLLYVYSRVQSTDWREWLYGHNLRTRIGGNNITAGNMLRNTNRDATLARNEIREVKAMVKALAKAQDEGTGKILEAVENAEREAIKVNAAEVAAELEVTAKEED